MTLTNRKKGIIAALVAIPCALAAGVWLVLNFQKDVPVTKADREMLITMTNVGPLLDAFQFDRKNEQISKVRYIDRSIDLEYEYEDDTVYVTTLVTHETRRSDAFLSFNAQWTGASLVMKFDENCKLQQTDTFYAYGDRSHFATIMCNGSPGGNVFSTVLGKNVYFLTMAGVYFDDAEEFTRFMATAMDRFTQWNP